MCDGMIFRLEPDTGRWWISSCGWPGEPFQPVVLGSVAIHELGWG